MTLKGISSIHRKSETFSHSAPTVRREVDNNVDDIVRCYHFGKKELLFINHKDVDLFVVSHLVTYAFVVYKTYTVIRD